MRIIHCEKDEKKSAWDRVLASRKKESTVGTEYIEDLFSDFTELHGDRYFGDDPAIVGGIARFHGMPVTVIAQEKDAIQGRMSCAILPCRHRRDIEKRFV